MADKPMVDVSTWERALEDAERRVREATTPERKKFAEAYRDNTTYDEKRLLVAAEMNDAGMVEAMLARKDIDVNKYNADGFTALDLALKNGNKEMAAALLKHSSMSMGSITSYTVEAALASKDRDGMLAFLEEKSSQGSIKGILDSVKNVGGRDLLESLIKDQQYFKVEKLLEKGVTVSEKALNAAKENYDNAPNENMRERNRKMYETLKVRREEQMKTPEGREQDAEEKFAKARRSGSQEEIDRANAYLNSNDDTKQLMLAFESGSVEKVKKILANPNMKPDLNLINSDGMRPLMIAIKNGDRAMAEALFEKSMEGKSTYSKAYFIKVALESKNPKEMLDFLEERFKKEGGIKAVIARAAVEGRDVLGDMVISGNAAGLQALLDRNVSVSEKALNEARNRYKSDTTNIENKKMYEALQNVRNAQMQTSEGRSQDAREKLAEAIGSRDEKNARNYLNSNDATKQLLLAVEKNNIEEVNRLLKETDPEKKPDLGARNRFGWNALQQAIGQGNTEIADALFKQTMAADPNSKIGLIEAAIKSKEPDKMLKFLEEKGIGTKQIQATLDEYKNKTGVDLLESQIKSGNFIGAKALAERGVTVSDEAMKAAENAYKRNPQQNKEMYDAIKETREKQQEATQKERGASPPPRQEEGMAPGGMRGGQATGEVSESEAEQRSREAELSYVEAAREYALAEIGKKSGDRLTDEQTQQVRARAEQLINEAKTIARNRAGPGNMGYATSLEGQGQLLKVDSGLAPELKALEDAITREYLAKRSLKSGNNDKSLSDEEKAEIKDKVSLFRTRVFNMIGADSLSSLTDNDKAVIKEILVKEAQMSNEFAEGAAQEFKSLNENFKKTATELARAEMGITDPNVKLTEEQQARVNNRANALLKEATENALNSTDYSKEMNTELGALRKSIFDQKDRIAEERVNAAEKQLGTQRKSDKGKNGTIASYLKGLFDRNNDERVEEKEIKSTAVDTKTPQGVINSEGLKIVGRQFDRNQDGKLSESEQRAMDDVLRNAGLGDQLKAVRAKMMEAGVVFEGDSNAMATAAAVPGKAQQRNTTATR